MSGDADTVRSEGCTMPEHLLARLILAGTPAHLVAEVALELGRAEALAEVTQRRRAKDRERKARPRNSVEVGGNRGKGGTPPDGPPFSPDPSSPL